MGLLGENDFAGTLGRANGGVEFVLTSDVVRRAWAQAATHGSERGPNLVMLGIAARLGRRRQ